MLSIMDRLRPRISNESDGFDITPTQRLSIAWCSRSFFLFLVRTSLCGGICVFDDRGGGVASRDVDGDVVATREDDVEVVIIATHDDDDMGVLAIIGESMKS
jgi:hypothetical protein